MNKKKQTNNRKREFYSTSSSSETPHDLFIPLPSKPPLALQIRSIADRLQFIGYQSMALTYTVFGAPQRHEATHVLPDTLFPLNNNTNKDKKDDGVLRNCKRRLHVIVESVGDVAVFSSSASWMQDYQLISTAPRNAATFRQACLSSHLDIVTLDYASVRGGLPYSIQSTDLRALFARGAVLEIPYAAAVVQSSLRPHFLQACRELELACIGVSRPCLLFSSGPITSADSTGSSLNSTNPNQDAVQGELALHSYTDVLHMITTLTGLKVAWFQGAGEVAIRHGERRRMGDMSIKIDDSSRRVAARRHVEKSPVKEQQLLKADDADESPTEIRPGESETRKEIEGEDGFISF